MSRARIALAAATVALGLVPAATAAAPAGLANARVEAVSDLTPAAAIGRFGGAEAVWLGWSVPAVAEARGLCCWRDDFRFRGCSLADRDNSWGNSDDRPPEGPAVLVVLAEARSGTVERIRLLSPGCPVDGARRRVVWLGDVAPAASLDLLVRIVDASRAGDDAGEAALAAIAYHLDPRAGRILEERALDRTAPGESREQAIFWSAQTRGEEGMRLASRILDTETDSELREHALFALSECRLPAAVERLKRAGVEDRDPEVRGQALFWLAQSGTPGAGDWIAGRLAAERDEEVREQAVFALAQLDDGADRLLAVLRTSRDPEIVRQALFWLGQSDDPRALAELTRLLED